MECLKFIAMVWLAILAGAGIMFAATVAVCVVANWFWSVFDREINENNER